MTELKDIYQDNVNWLNFAELKNGVLLTVSGLFLQMIIDNITSSCMKCILIFFCGVVILLTCVSFIPFLNSNKIIKSIAKKYYSNKFDDSLKCNNIVFYANVFLSSEKDYLQAVEKTIPNLSLDSLERNYINQIRAISAIASIKYFLFSISMQVFFLVIFAFIIVFFLF